MLTPAKLDAIPTENGFVIAAENPKQAASRQTPNPVIVSNPRDSIKIIMNGRSVTSSSNNPNKLPKSIKNNMHIAITNRFLFENLATILFMMTFMPLVFSIRLNTPLIMRRNAEIIMIVRLPFSIKTRKGAVIIFQNDIG